MKLKFSFFIFLFSTQLCFSLLAFKEFSLDRELNGLASAHTVLFSKDDVVGADKGKIIFWDLKNPEEKRPFEFDKKMSIATIALSSDGNRIAVGQEHGDFSIYSRAGEKISTVDFGAATVKSIGFNPLDDNRVLLTTVDGDITEYHIDKNQMLKQLRDKIEGFFFDRGIYSPDGTQVAVGFSTVGLSVHSVGIWGLGDKQVDFSQKPHDLTWQSVSEEELQMLEMQNFRGEIRYHKKTYKIIDSLLQSIAYSSDGKRIAAGFMNGNFIIWSAQTGKTLFFVEERKSPVTAVAFSPEGNLLVIGRGDGNLEIWDTGSCEMLQTIKAHTYRINSIAFSSDGSLIASAANSQPLPHLVRGEQKQGPIKIWKHKE